MKGHFQALEQKYQLSSLRMVSRGSRSTRSIRFVVAGLLALVCLLVFAPWQQTSSGEGRVIAFSPLDRPQSIEAPIDGRVQKWHVSEGSQVKTGDVIVEISDNDPDILVRLRSERDSVLRRIAALEKRESLIEQRVKSLTTSRKNALQAAAFRVKMASDRSKQSEKIVDATKALTNTTNLQVNRQRDLFNRGLTSKRAVELAELDSIRAETDYERARAAYAAAVSEQLAIDSDRFKLDADTQAVLDDAQASLASTVGDIANAKAELARMDVRLARQQAQRVVAPRDGTILKLNARQTTEMVKAGDSLAVLVPGGEHAVELWVSGNDTPLVRKGDMVRLQFEGWPALQFSGWPSIAVGTFGGRVALVDSADDGKGKFRIVVVPDEQEPWPSSTYLRQGTRVVGWVLLGQVRLGYEVWRQLNGFPPMRSLHAPADAYGKDKKDEKK